MNKQRGIGLPELLIVLMLSGFMIMLLSQQYLRTKKNYLSMQSELDQIIDQTRVSDLLRDSVRRIGFTPCLSIEHLEAIDRRFQNKPVVAFEWIIGGTALLSFSRMHERFDTVLQFMDSKRVLATGIEKIHPRQSILIADCYHAEVQTVAEVKYIDTGQIITLQMPMAYVYQSPIYIGPWIEETYFIKSDLEKKGSLFYRFQQAEELTTTIHGLSIDMIKEQGRRFLQIVLGLDHSKSITLMTMIRSV